MFIYFMSSFLNCNVRNCSYNFMLIHKFVCFTIIIMQISNSLLKDKLQRRYNSVSGYDFSDNC